MGFSAPGIESVTNLEYRGIKLKGKALAGNSGHSSKRRIYLYALGSLLFAICFIFVAALSLPTEAVLGLITPSLEANGIGLYAEKARLVFPLGIRVKNAAISINNGHPVPIEEATASWELTGLLNWLPSHLNIIQGKTVADIRLSPAFWNPSHGTMTLTEASSDELSFPFLSSSETKFSIRRIQAQWRGAGDSFDASGSAELDYLLLPVNLSAAPIHEARIDNASLFMVVRGDTLHIPRMQGSYEGARVEGTGEIAQFLSPGNASVTFLLKIRNPFEGRVGMLFDMLAKNSKNATLKISGAPGALKAEFLPL